MDQTTVRLIAGMLLADADSAQKTVRIIAIILLVVVVAIIFLRRKKKKGDAEDEF